MGNTIFNKNDYTYTKEEKNNFQNKLEELRTETTEEIKTALGTEKNEILNHLQAGNVQYLADNTGISQSKGGGFYLTKIPDKIQPLDGQENFLDQERSFRTALEGKYSNNTKKDAIIEGRVNIRRIQILMNEICKNPDFCGNDNNTIQNLLNSGVITLNPQNNFDGFDGLAGPNFARTLYEILQIGKGKKETYGEVPDFNGGVLNDDIMDYLLRVVEKKETNEPEDTPPVKTEETAEQILGNDIATLLGKKASYDKKSNTFTIDGRVLDAKFVVIANQEVNKYTVESINTHATKMIVDEVNKTRSDKIPIVIEIVVGVHKDKAVYKGVPIEHKDFGTKEALEGKIKEIDQLASSAFDNNITTDNKVKGIIDNTQGLSAGITLTVKKQEPVIEKKKGLFKKKNTTTPLAFDPTHVQVEIKKGTSTKTLFLKDIYTPDGNIDVTGINAMMNTTAN